MDIRFSYDRIKYPSLVFDHIRPDRLSAMAALHGLPISDVACWKILELGCGDGANLISIAVSMPNATCLGVDLSKDRIDEGREVAAKLGANNIDLRFMDVLEADPESIGKFDLIIAHGLFSWVPDIVRNKVLELCRECLEPNGFAFISYNAYPGWHFQAAIRDAMRFVEFDGEPASAAERGRAFIRFLGETAKPDSPYQRYLQEEAATLEKRDPASIYHDQLSENNQPFYFSEFVERAKAAGLKFLADAEPISYFSGSFPPEAQKVLDALIGNPIKHEQMRDHIRGARFKSTLLCLDNINASYEADSSVVTSLLISSQSRPTEEGRNLTDGTSVTFTAPRESSFATNHPFTKAAIAHLGSIWPERITFETLSTEIRRVFSALADSDFDTELVMLQSYLVNLYHSNVVEFFGFDPARSRSISERPKISPFARWQAETGFPGATGMLGTMLRIENDIMRALLMFADGTLTKGELVEKLIDVFEVPESERENVMGSIPPTVDDYLSRFLPEGLLVD